MRTIGIKTESPAQVSQTRVSDAPRAVTIGEMLVSSNPSDVMVAYGLGSCVAVCLYDPVTRVGGMIHSLLPHSPNGSSSHDGPPAKFVNRGVPALLGALKEMGALRSRLVAHLCGGAQVLAAPSRNSVLNVGDRNIAAAEQQLADLGIRIRAQATGGSTGRTVRFYLEDGRVTVRSLGQSEQTL